MFVATNHVRMHDTDMAGILFFANQFRWAHDALEDWMKEEGISFQELFTESAYSFVIVHCEADFLAPSQVGDELEVQLHIAHIGASSFTVHYSIFNQKGVAIGTCQTVHCCLKMPERKKAPLPPPFRKRLEKWVLLQP